MATPCSGPLDHPHPPHDVFFVASNITKCYTLCSGLSHPEQSGREPGFGELDHHHSAPWAKGMGGSCAGGGSSPYGWKGKTTWGVPVIFRYTEMKIFLYGLPNMLQVRATQNCRTGAPGLAESRDSPIKCEATGGDLGPMDCHRSSCIFFWILGGDVGNP